jgi:hypothetical protein
MSLNISAQDVAVTNAIAVQYAQMLLQEDAKGGNVPIVNAPGSAFTIQRTTLIGRCIITANQSSVQIAINSGDVSSIETQTSNAGTNKLQQQDFFICDMIGFFLNVLSTTSGGTGYGSYRFTAPPAQVISAQSQIDTWMDIWNSNMVIEINQRKVNTYWDLFNHYTANQTQYPNFVTSVATQQYPPQSQQNGATDGYMPCKPLIGLNGSGANKFTVNFNKGLASANLLGGSGIMAIELCLQGYLLANMSSMQRAAPAFGNALLIA